MDALFRYYFCIEEFELQQTLFLGRTNLCVRGCPKSRIAPFAIVYFGKKYYLTVAQKTNIIAMAKIVFKELTS
ncbi:hypothetical protein, partial [Coprobacter fastidiosus]|uniref:hypothetical protein n=1 Tax=Coprobacter fastidiosus TaxID=1099853 RepID=UPI001E07708E